MAGPRPGAAGPDLCLIAAVAENGVIGRGGRLPWRLREDLRRFRRLTLGHTLLMGRKTFAAIGRALPGRRSIVVSRTLAEGLGESLAAVPAANTVEFVPSLGAALDRARSAERVFVVGGAELYREALPQAHWLYLTRVHARVAGDAWFPEIDERDWQVVEELAVPQDEENDHATTFRALRRRPRTGAKAVAGIPMAMSTIAKQDRSALLKGWALEAGFDRAGVALLEPSSHGEALVRWLERGDQAGMAWLERRVPTRLEPASLLPGSRSVLCVALQYHPLAGAEQPAGDLWPRVARYARGEDYHQVMGERLRALAERIEAAFPGCRSRPYVDTGPLLERELAQRSGLGRIGKHTNLLHRDAGSWFLLGELLLTLELEPEVPVADLCGRCTRCLEACPTGALPEPYRLDARRCISYWTIEHRGAIPEAAREGIGDWVFGCDLCQEACPYNLELAPADHDELRLPAARAELDLGALLLLSREEYVARFRRSPMKRAKLDGLKRNAAIAMGNRRELRYVEALLAALREAEPVVRGHAAWALGRILARPAGEAAGPESGLRPLLERVRSALSVALALEGDPEARRELARTAAGGHG